VDREKVNLNCAWTGMIIGRGVQSPAEKYIGISCIETSLMIDSAAGNAYTEALFKVGSPS
jgi:hypothetical protein